jgi:hypothetical protein
MKIGELLRQIADIADAQDVESGNDADTVTTPSDLNAQADEYGDSPDEVYVGPLQQKHELLKKATGVENNVDQFAADDEIAQMQQNAGIQQAPTVININTAAPATDPAKQLSPAIISPLADLTDTD